MKHQVMLTSVLKQVSAMEIMVTDFRSLRPNELLSHALEHAYHGCQEDFPVVGEMGIKGILTRMDILSAIHDKGVKVPVAEVMDRNFTSVSPQTPLDDVYHQLLSSQKTAVAVLENGQLKGMLCLENISRYLMFHAAMRSGETKELSLET